MSVKLRVLLGIALIAAVSALSNVLPLERWLDSSRWALRSVAAGAGLPLPGIRVPGPPPPSALEARLDYTLRHLNTVSIRQLEVTCAALERSEEKLPPRLAHTPLLVGDILRFRRKMWDPLAITPAGEKRAPSPDSPSIPVPPAPEGE